MNELQQRILRLKREKNALLLAHFYQTMDIQEIADHVGDSFELARRAKETNAEVIVFCGVRFMAESAKLLNPEKTVLLPVMEAGCPMADTIRRENVLALKEEYPEAAVVCYVNSSAEVKSVSDICCTSSSALKIVKSLPNRQIIFIPDKNLGSYIAKQVPEKEVILYEGCCPVHDRILEEDILTMKGLYPNALAAVHPECRAEVLRNADYIGSTKGILDYVERSEHSEFIIGTEKGVVDRLAVTAPGKSCYLLTPRFVCPNMKKTQLQHVYEALEQRKHIIELSPDIMELAAIPLERMIELG